MRNVAVLMSTLLFLLISICPLSAQVLTTLTPNSATPNQKLDVVVRGVNTHFKNGVSQADFGPGITVQKFYVSNAFTGTATIQVNSSALIGFRDVKVTTGDEEASVDNMFEIFASSGMLKGNIEVLPVESISLSNIDLTQPTKTPVLFFVNIYNDNVARTVNLRVALSSTKGYVGEMKLNNRSLAPNQYLRLTNRDFTAVNMNGSLGDEFLKQVKKLGTFPPDNYEYALSITENGNLVASDESEVLVTNPVVNPDLISPGASFSQDIPEVYTPFPFFQWFGQNNSYDFTIYDTRPGQTPQDVVRNVPVFRKTEISGTDFLYPNYAEKLINGKIYAWQILGRITTATGIQYLPSEVYRFKYVDMTGGIAGKKVSRIQVVPDEVTVTAGKQYQFTAILYDADGVPVTNVKPVWRVNASERGSITQDGLFTAGDKAAALAVIVSVGAVTEFATVNIGIDIIVPKGSGDWGEDIFKQLFGL